MKAEVLAETLGLFTEILTRVTFFIFNHEIFCNFANIVFLFSPLNVMYILIAKMFKIR